MDARVNDFLSEIDEIAPLSDSKDDNVWEKCFDEESGYHYYWNTKTNEVTWDMPPNFKLSKSKTKKSPSLYIPPRIAPLFPSTSSIPPVADAIKIYKIADSRPTQPCNFSRKVSTIVKTENVPNPKEVKKKIQSRALRPNNSADDEKIVLISSYGGDSDESDDEQQKTKSAKKMNGSNHCSDAEEEDILKSIEKKGKEMESKSAAEPKSSLGFSLVAGYNSDSEEDEPDQTIEPSQEESKVAHSTLFPIAKPIDVKDFEQPKSKTAATLDDGDFSSKAFQRKRRIGVALVNKPRSAGSDEANERKGLGFSLGDNNCDESSGSLYAGFKSGGIAFVKSDVVLNAANEGVEGEKKEEDTSKVIEESYTTLKEKLGFLSEGREVVSPVQVMLIQIETLIAAFKSGDLKQSYLKKWLDETCSDLIKSEKETTPEGWLLQWDRSHKRYYYQNESTGETQWDYPDVTRCDEAMDICTTPPPNGAESAIQIEPPLPPVISSPSPPPPPIISGMGAGKPNEEKSEASAEPLPPGVESTEPAKSDDLNDVLNSFYSDIAAIENSNSPPVPEEAKGETEGASGEPAKKKKKTKVKLSQGIAMKKKGVSKLVEKWKTVQMSYNND